jgi:hypothetical protein
MVLVAYASSGEEYHANDMSAEYRCTTCYRTSSAAATKATSGTPGRRKSKFAVDAISEKEKENPL